MGFRGSIAPASLKPGAGVRPPAPHSKRRFRGSIAPASLKSTYPARGGSFPTSGFRGSIAPASLKMRGRSHFGGGRAVGFRGSIAPASLKEVRPTRPKIEE